MFKAIPWWEDGRGKRYYFVHFDFINLLTIIWAFLQVSSRLDSVYFKSCITHNWNVPSVSSSRLILMHCRSADIISAEGVFISCNPTIGGSYARFADGSFRWKKSIGETGYFPLALANSCRASRLFYYLKRVLVTIIRKRFSCHLDVDMGKLGE